MANLIGGPPDLHHREGHQPEARRGEARDDELGFAIAQFGAEKSRGFAEAIGAARAQVAEAFRLKQALDDSTMDSP
ncbi:MAG: hypothetical protein MUP97_06890, partial [Acidimicrobiia bacterium]|nr:hypothetical protein [Acidimicrobiia bacterium]